MELVPYITERNPVVGKMLEKFTTGLDNSELMPVQHIAGGLLILDRLNAYFGEMQEKTAGTPQAEEAAAMAAEIRSLRERAGRMGMSSDGAEVVDKNVAQAGRAGVERYLAHIGGLEATQPVYGETPAWHGLLGGSVDRASLESHDETMNTEEM